MHRARCCRRLRSEEGTDDRRGNSSRLVRCLIRLGEQVIDDGLTPGVQARINGSKVNLLIRKGLDWTDSFKVGHVLLKGPSQLGQPVGELIAVLRHLLQLERQLPGNLLSFKASGTRLFVFLFFRRTGHSDGVVVVLFVRIDAVIKRCAAPSFVCRPDQVSARGRIRARAVWPSVVLCRASVA